MLSWVKIVWKLNLFIEDIEPKHFRGIYEIEFKPNKGKVS